jgi:hypothetical protein
MSIETGIPKDIQDTLIGSNDNAVAPVVWADLGEISPAMQKYYKLTNAFVIAFNEAEGDSLVYDGDSNSTNFIERIENFYTSLPSEGDLISETEKFYKRIVTDAVHIKYGIPIFDRARKNEMYTPLSLRKYGVTRVLSDPVQAVLHQNDLKGAMQIIGKEFRSGHKRLAKALAKVTGTTKIVIKRNLVNANGKNVPGYFSPKENTIYLDQALGMNYHTLMHEGMHMATAHALDPKSEFYNPTFKKRVETIYNEVKDTDAVMDNSNIPDNEFYIR